MNCDRCGKENTEYSTFTTKVRLGSVVGRVKFRCNSWVRRVVKKYIAVLTRQDLEVEIKVCQTCQSVMFRKLDRDK